MKNVFKWRIVTNKYLYITDENNGDPFILDKITGNRIYPNGIVTGTTVDDGKIGQIVSNIKVENTYKDLFDAMVRLAYTDSDASKLTFLDYKNYWNLDSDECVIEAVTPKCEGYEPVFNISAHTISDGEVEYTFYAERNEYDKTLRYNLDLGIPKGEKGDKGKDGKGCKGDQGEPGQNAIIQVIDATAHPIPSGSAPTATVVTATTQSDNTYTMSFDFGIPKGESGGTGGPGEKGDDGYSGVITDVVPYTNTVGHNDPANVTVSNIQIVKNDVNSRYETSFDLNFDIPKGETGAMGPEGLPAIFRQCDARVVETLDWYETAQVEAILTPLGFENKYDLTFEFKIPKGKPGENSIVESGGTAGGGWIYNFNVPEFMAVTGLREPIGDFDVQYHQASGDADVTLRIYYPEDWGGTTPGGRGRSIEVNDSEILSSSSSTPLNLTDGTGVTISGDTGGTVTISHEDTSNQPTVVNTGSTYIQTVELDDMGHVVGLGSSSISETYRPIEVNDVQILDKNETSKTLNLVNGTGISISGSTDGTVTINSTVVNTDTHRPIQMNSTQILGDNTTALNLSGGTNISLSNTGGTIEISHADTSTATTVTNSGRTYIQSVELDNMGHVVGLESATETVTDTWRPVSANTSAITSTDSLVLSGGTNVTLSTGRTGNTTIVTINADVPDAMEFKGTLGVGGTISTLPNDGTANIGDTYKVITDGTYESQTAKIGDLFICNDKTSHSNAWVYVPSGDDPSGSGTVTSVLAGTGLVASPNPITTTGTISHKDTSNQPSVINTGSTYIQTVELDGMGHVVGLGSSPISETYRPIEVNDVQILDKNETSKTLNLVNGTGISISGATDGTVTINSTVVNTDTTYKLTLNGTQKGSGTTDLGTFYAPTSGGTSGQYLKSNGNGAPIWDTFPTIPSAPGTLTTTATTSQTAVTDESLSGTINLHKISKTGNYNDLLNKPTIPAAQVNADWNASSGVAEILNKPTLATVATSGSYNDLSNKPTIPVNTDYQVQQSSSTTNDEYCLLAKATTGATSVTGTTIFATGITINPADNSIHVSGETQIEGELYVNDDTHMKDALYVTGETQIEGGLRVTGNTYIDGGLHITGDTYMKDALYVTGETQLEGGLYVTGETQLNSGLTVSGASADITDGLNITGNTYCTGVYYASGTYSSSDIRKKDVLGEISLDKAYELVNKCQTIFYNWKDDETNKKEIGLIAQEVQQYFPELVSEDKDGYLTLDYSKLTVILLTVIKDLTQKVNKIDKLEEKIKMLEEKLK